MLAADSKARTVFQASREEGPAELHFTPTSYQASVDGGKVGALRVTYYASTVEVEQNAAETFQVPDLTEPLNEAIIAPEAPFSGTATFHLLTPKRPAGPVIWRSTCPASARCR